MRVLYFSASYTSHDLRFITQIVAGGHAVLHASFGGQATERRALPAGAQRLEWAGTTARVTEPRDVLPLMSDFERMLGELSPDLIHAGPVQTCALMAALADFHPLVVMSWGSDMLVDAVRDDQWRWATSRALRGADGAQCDCDTVRAAMCAFHPLPADRIAQFPWGVDLDRYHPARDSRPAPQHAETVTLLSTRNWEPFYAIDVLLQGFEHAYRRDPRLRLILAGDGSQAPAIQRYIAANGLEDAVGLPGRIDNDQLAEVFRSADAYVSCALNDGASISLLEAMATGLPVIATDVPSNAEWIEHGLNGWLARARDAEAVAECLAAAARLGAERRAGIAAQNRSIAERRADWFANAPRLLELYARLT